MTRLRAACSPSRAVLGYCHCTRCHRARLRSPRWREFLRARYGAAWWRTLPTRQDAADLFTQELERGLDAGRQFHERWRAAQQDAVARWDAVMPPPGVSGYNHSRGAAGNPGRLGGDPTA